jgi:excisionase family DNA binding protein
MIGGSNKLVSTAELAAYLNVPLKTIQSNWKRWGLPGFRVGKHVRFRERDVHAWLEAREREAQG